MKEAEPGASQIQGSGIQRQTFDKNPFYAKRGSIQIRNTKLQKEFLWRNSVLNVSHSNLQRFQAVPKPYSNTKQVLLLVLADKYPFQHPFACSSPSLKCAPCSHLQQQLGACFVCCSLIGTGGERGLEPRCSIGSKSAPSPVTGQTQLPGEANGLRVLQIRITTGSY